MMKKDERCKVANSPIKYQKLVHIFSILTIWYIHEKLKRRRKGVVKGSFSFYNTWGRLYDPNIIYNKYRLYILYFSYYCLWFCFDFVLEHFENYSTSDTSPHPQPILRESQFGSLCQFSQFSRANLIARGRYHGMSGRAQISTTSSHGSWVSIAWGENQASCSITFRT